MAYKINKWISVPIVIFATLGFVLWLAANYLPNPYNPFMPLQITEKPTFVTKFKIAQLKGDTKACFTLLENSHLRYDLIEDSETGANCGFYDAVQLKQSTISYGGNITLTCPALVSLAMWEMHSLQPLAEQTFDQKIDRVRHYGTYACRNINSAKKGRRSQHALANAIDIAGFRLQDGTELSVLNHWHADNTKGEFIRNVHDSACQYFKTVLGPEYNDLHKDHFHFDMGSSLVCR